MLALYRSSRQADALRAYQLLKSRLGEELGIEPSSGLRKLEEQIVTGDEALETRSRATACRARRPSRAWRCVGTSCGSRSARVRSGTAYRAYQPAVGREVAIKVIRPDLANDPAFIRRFQAEAQLVATLEHPHIVPLYDYWREPDAAYLVMRLMRGGSLASVLEHGALTPAQTITMVDQLGNALQTAHRSGVVHGDINPDNVLIDDEGNAYLSDFGIAVGDVDEPSLASARTSTASASSSRRHSPVGRGERRRDSRRTARSRLPVSSTAPPTSTPPSATRRRRPSSPICTRRSDAEHGTDGRPTARAGDRRSTTRTRGCGRSTPSMPSTSTAANGSSNG